MDILGLQKTTLLDYPGKVACTVFVGGCNFRCPYCYNPDLVLKSPKLHKVPKNTLFSFLGKRRKVLEGVVVCGGEPTFQGDLGGFLEEVKALGFLVKLDTNGSQPNILESLVKSRLIDFVSLDIKAPLGESYCRAVGVSCDGKEVRESMEVLSRGGVDFELRTTVVPTLHTKKDLVNLAIQISSLAFHSLPPKWYLQQFQPGHCLDSSFDSITPYKEAELEDMLAVVRRYMPEAALRGV